jgi:hypothetical protein
MAQSAHCQSRSVIDGTDTGESGRLMPLLLLMMPPSLQTQRSSEYVFSVQRKRSMPSSMRMRCPTCTSSRKLA